MLSKDPHILDLRAREREVIGEAPFIRHIVFNLRTSEIHISGREITGDDKIVMFDLLARLYLPFLREGDLITIIPAYYDQMAILHPSALVYKGFTVAY